MRFIADYVKRLEELETNIKTLNELSQSRNRLTNDMKESLRTTDSSTKELIDRLNNVKSRIKRRTDVLRKYQALLESLRVQVELQQRGSRGLFPGWHWAVGIAVGILIVFLALLARWWLARNNFEVMI